MSYFDDNFTGGAKSDDEDDNTINDSGSETEDDNEAKDLDEDLDDKVAETHSLFERHEILKVKFKQEWFIIKNYEYIKHQKLETI